MSLNLRQKYYTWRWKTVRREARARDKNRCRNCGKAGYLEVHHVIPARKRPDLFFSLGNLVTLCRGCHFKETERERTQTARLSGYRKSKKEWTSAVNELRHEGV